MFNLTKTTLLLLFLTLLSSSIQAEPQTSTEELNTPPRLSNLDKNIKQEQQLDHRGDKLSYLEVTVATIGGFAAIISVIMVIGSIWFSLHFKKANNQYKESKQTLDNLQTTDKLIKVKIDGIQKTLVMCLTKAEDRDEAFSVYSKILDAYDILLSNGDQTYIEDDYQIKATILASNIQYVPKTIQEYLINESKLSFDTKKIILSQTQST